MDSFPLGISLSIINRTAGTHYVNEAVVKAAGRLFFARAHTPAADVSRPSGHLPPPARPTSRSGTFLLRMRLYEVSRAVTRLLPTSRTDVSCTVLLRRPLYNDAVHAHAKLIPLGRFRSIRFNSRRDSLGWGNKKPFVSKHSSF